MTVALMIATYLSYGTALGWMAEQFIGPTERVRMNVTSATLWPVVSIVAFYEDGHAWHVHRLALGALLVSLAGVFG